MLRIAEQAAEDEQITEEVDKDILQCISSDEDEEAAKIHDGPGYRAEDLFKLQVKDAEIKTDEVIQAWRRNGDGRLVKTSLTRVVTEKMSRSHPIGRWEKYNRHSLDTCSPRQNVIIRNAVRKRARAAISTGDSSPTLPSSKFIK